MYAICTTFEVSLRATGERWGGGTGSMKHVALDRYGIDLLCENLGWGRVEGGKFNHMERRPRVLQAHSCWIARG